jgi:Tfp pilus assembly protein PilX
MLIVKIAVPLIAALVAYSAARTSGRAARMSERMDANQFDQLRSKGLV